jgi:hypothetical protein
MLPLLELSEQTRAVLTYFERYTGGNIRKSNDFASLLEFASVQDAADEFNHIVFLGKCVWNLYTALRKATTHDEAYQMLEREFAENLNNLRAALAALMGEAPEPVRLRFHDTYLGLGQGTVRNIVDFAHDLARFKDMQNDARSQHGGQNGQL